MPEILYATTKKKRSPHSKQKTIPQNDAIIYKDTILFLKNELSEVNEKYQAVNALLTKETETLATLKTEYIAAQQQVIKLRASTAYQLGLSIINARTSVRKLFTLPLTIWRLYAQVAKKVHKPIDSKPSNKISLIKHIQIFIRTLIKKQTPPVLLTDALQKKISALAKRPALSLVKVACIMDEFTWNAFQPECELKQLSVRDWENELESFQPQLLFIESAWRGKDNEWDKKIGQAATELKKIIDWCKQKSTPTVFWNKEDPIHFQNFINTAKLFDYVFTTDLDCIHRYKAALGHERIYFLPFACQPLIHNPIERYHRKNAISFAGAYYVRYPERAKDLENFLQALTPILPIDIYDRNYGKNDPAYQFPIEYKPYIIGTLPFNKIDQAYKGYKYCLNLNSIKQSQTMFARRVFELLASNTLTISNFSQGLRLLLGDLVMSSDGAEYISDRLTSFQNQPDFAGKIKLAALRKVMMEHSYEQRFDYICAKANIQKTIASPPSFAVLAKAITQAEADRLIHQFLAQRYEHKKLILVISADIKPITNNQVHYLHDNSIKRLVLDNVINDATWVASMLSNDYYGPNYLFDIALALRYSNASLIGKAAYFQANQNTFKLMQLKQMYKPIERLAARRSAIKVELVRTKNLTEWLDALPRKILKSTQGLSIDPYNYCKETKDIPLEKIQFCVDDLATLNLGLGVNELQLQAENILASQSANDKSMLTPDKIFTSLNKSESKKVDISWDDCGLVVDSTLADGQHEYLYSQDLVKPEMISNGNQIKCFFDIEPGLIVSFVVLFLNESKQRISHKIFDANRNLAAVIPNDTTWLRLGLRVLSSGKTTINGIVIGHRNLQPDFILSTSKYLVLTNHYPAYNDYYRNAFVHSRVKEYAQHGIKIDVFRFQSNASFNYNEFENTNVMTGGQACLDKLLSSGKYQNILVHFLDDSMWEILEKYKPLLKITVWVHGSEIQPFHRREFNYTSDAQRALEKIKSLQRIDFWQKILQPMPSHLQLIFVSQYFMEEVSEDLGLKFPENQVSIIHNPIDTLLFSYTPKSVEQRKKILSIRPFASAKYANDLSVQMILSLSKEPWFKDLEFRIIGDGILFDKILQPLRSFNNVYIEKRFLKQVEIAQLHKEYGIFLCPSRMDSQGVSRDEAMSSGLVPITNHVTAIPEFVDEHCGILAPDEDVQAMVEGMTKLYKDPNLFTSMSMAAAHRVRQQSGAEKIIAQEIQVANLKQHNCMEA
jgi:glycosyltransferase involved in cell wall biosynthesis/spore maturation protein CgeB